MFGVLSLAPCYVRKKQVRDKGVPLSYHHGKAVSSLVDDCQTMHPPPALLKRRGQKKEKDRSFTSIQMLHTHQKLLHTEAFTHRSLHTQKLLHTEAFTHKHFYTQKLLHTEAFTHRSFYTQSLLHTEPFTHRTFYAQKIFPIHSDTFTHRRF